MTNQQTERLKLLKARAAAITTLADALKRATGAVRVTVTDGKIRAEA